MTTRTKKPKPSTDKLPRVYRGGSWNDTSATYVRAAFRIDDTPMVRVNDIGFRITQTGCCQALPAQK